MPRTLAFVIGNVVVVLAALGLSQTTVWWFGGGRGWGTMTLLGGVIAVYALDRVRDAAMADRSTMVARFGGPFVLGCVMVVAGLALVPKHVPIVLALAIVGGAYVPLKRLVPKGVLTAGAWATALVWLPGATTLSVSAGMPVAASLFLIVIANAVLCDALDVESDRAKGVRGLAPWLGARRASLAAAVLAFGGGVLAVLHGPWPLAVAAGGLMVACAVPDVPRGVEWRKIALDLVMVLPGAVVVALGAR